MINDLTAHYFIQHCILEHSLLEKRYILLKFDCNLFYSQSKLVHLLIIPERKEITFLVFGNANFNF